jgi:phage terminase large subunit-like protein
VRVKSDANNKKRPVKPTQDDHRKIDGIVAAIMALGVMMEGVSRRRRSVGMGV